MDVARGGVDHCAAIPASVYEERRTRLAERLAGLRLRYLLVTKPVDIDYLSGFRGSAGALVIGPRQPRLWVDPRYTLQAREESRGVEIAESRHGLLRAVGRWARRRRVPSAGWQDAHLTGAEMAQLRSESRGSGAVRWRGVGVLLDDLRVVKDRWEIERIRRAGRLTASVFEQVLHLVKPGVRECDLAAELEYRMKLGGGEGPAFETIVASGPRGAWPHARASARALRAGELVIFDLGAILGGYAADMTRTVFLGEPNRRVRNLYSAVMKAQTRAVRAVQDATPAGEIDCAARRILAKHRLARYFTHSTGHGVGLEIHERPRLGKGETTCLRTGSVVTVEPGIYLEGFGGIRIEDTVLVGPEGPEVLTPASKECWVIR